MYPVAIYLHDDVSHLKIHNLIDWHTLNVDHTIAVEVKILLRISVKAKQKRN